VSVMHLSQYQQQLMVQQGGLSLLRERTVLVSCDLGLCLKPGALVLLHHSFQLQLKKVS
jgi:hypothetical protein